MSERIPEITLRHLNGKPVRTVRIDGTDFVSMQDFCTYLQGLAGKFVELSTRQGQQLSSVSGALEVLCEVLSKKHPELREALLQSVQRASRLN